jgi:hypothetical protein
MEKSEMSIGKLTELYLRQESRLRMLEETCEAYEMVLAWLLSRQPGDAGLVFLSQQANAFDQPEHRKKWIDAIQLLDHLRVLVGACSDSSGAAQAPQ